ncbi:MAG: cyclic nucleotide-binding domain-containing protein [Kiritimatiellae bacterium]|nr:cyclic nucleotide-binding domain-containing protein [Kiritimatiellia bacterium]MDD5522812.1 cyclic nucleotide-binding domain-containing protein [Kiritimatiellia bacterium]
MVFGQATRLFLTVLVLGNFAVNSFAEDKAKAKELSKALDQAKLFAGLTVKERTVLKSAAILRYCKEGERIIAQGKPLDRMFIVLEGQAEVRISGKLVATLSGQSLVGEVEFLDMLPASADVVITKETRLIELNNAVLTGLMNKHPRLGYVLLSEIARIEGQRLRAMDQK